MNEGRKVKAFRKVLLLTRRVTRSCLTGSTKAVLYLLVVPALSLLVGCNAGQDAGDSDSVTIGYAAPTLADEGQVAIRQGAVVAAEKLGWDITTTDAERDAAKQINQVDSLIARGVDALVIVPVDSAALAVAVEKANEHEIPVLTIDRKTSGGDLLLTVQSDNYMAGQQAAERMLELLKAKHGAAKGLVLELQGSLGTNVAQLRGAGFNDVMKKHAEIKVISKPTDWDPDKGAMTTADILTIHPELNSRRTRHGRWAEVLCDLPMDAEWAVIETQGGRVPAPHDDRLAGVRS